MGGAAGAIAAHALKESNAVVGEQSKHAVFVLGQGFGLPWVRPEETAHVERVGGACHRRSI